MHLNAAGAVRSKNATSILLKNFGDITIGMLVWWAVGNSFAYGADGAAPNSFIGGNNFFFSRLDLSTETGTGYLRGWIFQSVFAATAATIVSGALAERVSLAAYFTYVVALTGFIYPVVVHWVWSSEGFLSAFPGSFLDGEPSVEGTNGFIDFAGSVVVHGTGGLSALIGAWLLGPRSGRFDSQKNPMPMKGHNVIYSALGTFILAFGWMGFNPGSTLAIVGVGGVAIRTAVTTYISGAASSLSALMINYFITGHLEITPAMNGLLGGLVAICSGCSTVPVWAAFVIGLIAGGVYIGSSRMQLYVMKIDDCIDAAPVHLWCGIWGVLGTGFFMDDKLHASAYSVYEEDAYGAFMGGDGKQLGMQILGTIVVLTWVTITSMLMFGSLKMLGILRVDESTEEAGMDESHHGGSAYNFEDAKSANGKV